MGRFDIRTKENKLDNQNDTIKKIEEEKNKKLEEQKKEIQRKQQEINKLNKLITDSNRVPEPDVFDIQGIPRHIASRYYVVYVQLVLLAETANAPKGNLQWLRNVVRKGVLHNVLEAYNLSGIDTSVTPPKIVARLTVHIDWNSSKLYANLNADKEKKLTNIHNQPTMTIAKAFADIVKRENLKTKMSCSTIKKPSLEALHTLGAPKYLNQYKKGVNITYKDFKNLIYEKLNLVNDKALEWRKGDEFIFESISDLTPEMKVRLKYVPSKNDELDSSDFKSSKKKIDFFQN